MEPQKNMGSEMKNDMIKLVGRQNMLGNNAEYYEDITPDYELTMECDHDTLLIMLDMPERNFRGEFNNANPRQYRHLEVTTVQNIFKQAKNPEICTVDPVQGILRIRRRVQYMEGGREEFYEQRELKLTKWTLNDGLKLQLHVRRLARRSFQVEKELRNEIYQLKCQRDQIKENAGSKTLQKQWEQIKQEAQKERQRNQQKMKAQIKSIRKQLHQQLKEELKTQIVKEIRKTSERQINKLKEEVSEKLKEVKKQCKQIMKEIRQSSEWSEKERKKLKNELSENLKKMKNQCKEEIKQLKKVSERSRKELEEEIEVIENKIADLMEGGRKVEKKAEEKKRKEQKGKIKKLEEALEMQRRGRFEELVDMETPHRDRFLIRANTITLQQQGQKYYQVLLGGVLPRTRPFVLLATITKTYKGYLMIGVVDPRTQKNKQYSRDAVYYGGRELHDEDHIYYDELHDHIYYDDDEDDEDHFYYPIYYSNNGKLLSYQTRIRLRAGTELRMKVELDKGMATFTIEGKDFPVRSDILSQSDRQFVPFFEISDKGDSVEWRME